MVQGSPELDERCRFDIPYYLLGCARMISQDVYLDNLIVLTYNLRGENSLYLGDYRLNIFNVRVNLARDDPPSFPKSVFQQASTYSYRTSFYIL